jgi:hypothetical protein
MSADYEPYGTEWEKEMNKFTKAELINMLREAYKKINESEKRYKILTLGEVCERRTRQRPC